MSVVRRISAAVTALAATAVVLVALAPSASAQPQAPGRAAGSAPPAAAVVSSTSAPTAAAALAASTSVPCSSIRQIGDKKVVSDLGMSAFTVRQYIGWCSDSRGSAWMNFASVYVWDQYHVRGFAYRSYAGVAVRGEQEPRGFTVSANRQQLTPVLRQPGLGRIDGPSCQPHCCLLRPASCSRPRPGSRQCVAQSAVSSLARSRNRARPR